MLTTAEANRRFVATVVSWNAMSMNADEWLGMVRRRFGAPATAEQAHALAALALTARRLNWKLHRPWWGKVYDRVTGRMP